MPELVVLPHLTNHAYALEDNIDAHSAADFRSLRRMGMSTVSITRLRVRSWQFLPAFLFHTILSAWQARNATGIQSATLLKDNWRTYWTRTVWTDQSAMKMFMASGNHRRAMPKLLELCDEASVGRWNQDDVTPPIWGEVHRRMQYEGRPSKVNHPSAAQAAFEIPVPQVRPFSQITLKRHFVRDGR